MAAMSASPRVYGGRSLEERRKERRRRFLDATTTIWGEEGWTAVTMRRVCAEARLVDRYFYECFEDRDALLAAVWDEIRDESMRAAIDAAAPISKDPVKRLRAVIAAIVHGIAKDRKRARIRFDSHAGNPVLEARHKAEITQFADVVVTLLRPNLKPGASLDAVRRTALLAVGGFVALVVAWRDGIVELDAEGIIEQATADGAALAARYLAATQKRSNLPRRERR